MELRQAFRKIPAWEHRFYRIYDPTVGSDREISDLLAWHRELAPLVQDPVTIAHLGILEGETARLNLLRGQTDRWRTQAPEPLRSLAFLLQSAYLDVPLSDQPERVLAFVRETLPPGWFRNRLEERLARKMGDPKSISDIQRSEAARSGRLLDRYRFMTGLDLVILFAFALALPVFFRYPSGFWRFGPASIPPRWPRMSGATVLIRGFAVGILLGFVPGFFVRAPDAVANLISYMLWSLPILFLAKRHLFNPDQLRPRNELGLAIPSSAWKKLAVVLLVGLGIDSVGSWLLSRAGGLLQLPDHWAESFEPDLVWGGRFTLGASLAGIILLGPWVEEVVFRGLLYGTFRTSYGWLPSAVLSAGLFSFVHGYGLLGFAAGFWSGVVYAWIYEKSGSLLPGFAVHALGNLLFSLNLIVMFRLP